MADIVTSQTRIANRALIILGSAKRIISVDDDHPLARQIKDIWHESRRAAIVDHPFNFAIFRQMLNASAEAPAFGWSRKFLIPPEALRWLPPSRDDDDYFEGVEEGGYILTDAEAPLPFRGIRDVEDVSRWSAGFVHYFAYRLAEDLVTSETQSQGDAATVAEKRMEALIEARRIDGLATGDRSRGNVVTQSRWIAARFAPTSGRRSRI